MVMFARWMATCYADTRKTEGGLSILNMENGYWWKDRLEHFNKVVLPTYTENGNLDEFVKFLK